MTTKATLYLDTDLYKTLKLRAVESRQAVSTLVNDALQAQLAEDFADIASINKRLSKNEQPISYESALKELAQNGLI